MMGLPDQPRRPDEKSDRKACPWPTRAEKATWPDEQQSARTAAEEKDDQRLVEERDSSRNPRPQPQVSLTGADRPKDEPGYERPGQEVERGGAQQMAGDQEDRGNRRGPGGDELGTASCSE